MEEKNEYKELSAIVQTTPIKDNLTHIQKIGVHFAQKFL